jgi:hypothetical protein
LPTNTPLDDAFRAKVRNAQLIHEKARQFRGRFLNSMAVIEYELSAILVEYFCRADEEKRELFSTDVVGRMTFEAKRALVSVIVKGDYPRYFEENRALINDLQEFQALRNKLAHSVVDVSEAALARPLTDGIGFIQWKNAQPITEIEFNDWDARATTSYGLLRDIRQLLPFKEKPAP